MNPLSRTFALGVVVCVSACGGASMNTYTPVHEKTKYSADSLHIAARDAIDQLGYQPSGGDSGAHVIETREKQVAVSSIPRLSYKYAFKIETTNGVLDIEATCLENSASSEDTFKDCGDDRPQRVINEQKKLLKRILEIAPNAESKNYNWEGFGQTPPDDSDDKPEKADKDEKSDKGKKADKDEKSDKDKKADKDEKADKGKKDDKSDKGKKADKDEKSDKGKKADKDDKSDKGKKADKDEKSDKGKKADKDDKGSD